MTKPYESLSAQREFLTETYRKAVAKLDAMEGAHDAIALILADWRSRHDDTYAARIYVGKGSLMATLVLGADETFGDAAEVFEAAEPAIKAAIPADWKAEWSEVRDDSDEHHARRQIVLHAAPPGSAWYYDGFSVWLTVEARIGEGSACQVVQIGERKTTVSHVTEKLVPVFKSICPGDPAPLAAE